MKALVEKTAFRTGFQAVSRFERNGTLLLSVLLIASGQFSTSTRAAFISPHGGAYSQVAASSALDGASSITAESREKQPAPDGGDSPNFPDSPTDIDDSDGGLDHLSADNSTRKDQDTSHCSVTDLEPASLRAPGNLHVFIIPADSFYCLHEHTRERAPPRRAEALAKADLVHLAHLGGKLRLGVAAVHGIVSADDSIKPLIMGIKELLEASGIISV